MSRQMRIGPATDRTDSEDAPKASASEHIAQVRRRRAAALRCTPICGRRDPLSRRRSDGR